MSLRETGADPGRGRERGRDAGDPDLQRLREGREVAHRIEAGMERRRIRLISDQTIIREEKIND